ncbi:MAG: TVP38/TMEM64 family protein, partial [Limisphaerales bacterium]
GTLIASFSATLGASFSFLIGRYLARDKVEKRAHKNEKLRAIDAAIGEQGWKIVGLLRLSPFIPFNFSNYFFGITKIRFWPYVLASWIGMLPGTLLYVYLGHIGKATFGGGHQRTTQEYVFLGVGLVATIALTIYLTRLAKKALKKQNGAEHIEKT